MKSPLRVLSAAFFFLGGSFLERGGMNLNAWDANAGILFLVVGSLLLVVSL